MSRLWTDEHKYKTWADVEIAACEAWGALGRIPKKALGNIKKRASKLDIRKISEIEKTVKHDVIAFLTALSEAVGPDSRFIHVGLTSSDVLDTALAVQLKSASDIILSDIEKLLKVLKRRAFEFKKTPMVGRTHGIHAEPTTFGLKFALWHAEFDRLRARLLDARKEIAVGKISGAVGTFAHVPMQIENYVCKKLGLRPEPVSTQIVQRDRHAQFFATLALIASSIEKVATEIRHLQRSEILEVEEPFTKGQKGSSAMPHKRNPVLSENICGLARLVRTNALASMENVALWHERDISHSSVERVIAPDSTILVDFMLGRLAEILDGLHVYPEMMRRNLEKLGGLIFSQRILLALVEAGMQREAAYKIIQQLAMQAWKNIRTGRGDTFQTLVAKNKTIRRYMNMIDIRRIFDVGHYFKNVDNIFKRTFGAKR